MSRQISTGNPVSRTLAYFGMAGLALGLIIAHAQYIVKVGEVQVVYIIPLALSFIMVHACRLMESKVNRSLQKKRLKPTYGKGADSRYWLNSLDAEVVLKSTGMAVGLFLGVYFLGSLILLATPALVNFVVSIDAAGILVLVLGSYLKEKGIIKKR